MEQPQVSARGTDVPAIGLGTWQLRGETCYRAVRHALDVGYRHLDTAELYGNEDEVGRALADSDVDRDEVWLTTKVRRRNLAPDDLQASATASLRRLGTDHVDLLLIHWPSRRIPLRATLGKMVSLRDAGQVRHVGVSNFPGDMLTEAVQYAPVLCDQVEYHPFLAQEAVLDAAREHDVLVVAYSPLAQGRVAGDDVLAAIGAAHDATAPQVALRWLVQQGVAALPRSSDPDHISANLDVAGFSLDDAEMARIADLARGERLIDPAFAPDWD